MIDSYVAFEILRLQEEEKYVESFALIDWNYKRAGFGSAKDPFLKIPKDALRCGALRSCTLIKEWLIKGERKKEEYLELLLAMNWSLTKVLEATDNHRP